jgi:hypothetical protein
MDAMALSPDRDGFTTSVRAMLITRHVGRLLIIPADPPEHHRFDLAAHICPR